MSTHNLRRSLVLAFASAAVLPGALHAQPARRRTRGDAINDDIFERRLPSAESYAIWTDFHRSELAPLTAQRAGLADGALEDLFADLSQVAFYTALADAALAMALVLDELARRGLSTAEQMKAAYRSLYGARLLAEAEQLRTRYALPALPRMRVAPGVGNHTPAHIVVTDGRSEVYAVRSELPRGPLVIMVASPFCHPSNRAVAAIESDPALKARLAKVMRLMTPHEQGFPLEELQQWNREHPAFPMTMAYHQQGWPMLDLNFTPQFYFFRDGALIRAMPRWPDGGAADMIEALRSIGA